MPLRLWQAVADAVKPTFADSYLAKAVVVDRDLWPKTTIAYDRLSRDGAARQAVKNQGFVLRAPVTGAEPDYDALSLREKIRRHEILASRAYDRAGPLYRLHGRDRGELRKHEAWNDMERVEAAHFAEAKRMTESLHSVRS